MENNLKKNEMEDDLKKMEDDLKIKMEDDLKKAQFKKSTLIGCDRIVN